MFKALFAYLASAYLLGLSHSLQPGHGKTAALTFGTDSKRNWKDILVLALSAGLFQLLLLLFLGFVLEWSFFSLFRDNVRLFFTRSAAGVICAWGVVELVRAILQYHFRHKHHHHPDDCTLMKKPWLHKLLEKTVLGKSRYFSSFVVGLSIGLVPCPIAFSGLMTSVLTRGFSLSVLYASMFCLGMCTVLLFCASALRWPFPIMRKIYVRINHLDERHPYALSFLRGLVLLLTGLVFLFSA